MINHKDRTHALLSASSSKRWLTCTPSARLEEHEPERKSAYAEEGTKAHELAEKMLKGFLNNTPYKISADEKDIYAELEEYIDYVIETYNEYKAKNKYTIMFLETRLNFSNFVPQGFGTGDVLIVSDKTLHVIDLKFGKGVRVNAEHNEQLRLYGIGALNFVSNLYEIDTIKMTIHQPRLHHVTTETLEVKELLTWANEIKPIAEKAYRGEGELVTGDHCRFCKIKLKCRKVKEEMIENLKIDVEPKDLSNDEIAKLLELLPRIKSYIKELEDYALANALNGEKFKGFKVVEGRSRRVIKNEPFALKVLTEVGGFETFEVTETKLLGLTKLEKVVGAKKLTEILGDLIEKAQGAPTLVPDSDPRTELNRTDEIINSLEID